MGRVKVACSRQSLGHVETGWVSMARAGDWLGDGEVSCLCCLMTDMFQPATDFIWATVMTSAYCACHGDIQGPPLVWRALEGTNLNKGVPSHGQGSVFQIKTQNALCSRRSRKDKYLGQSGHEGTWKAWGHGYDLWDSEKSKASAGLSQISSSSQKKLQRL